MMEKVNPVDKNQQKIVTQFFDMRFSRIATTDFFKSLKVLSKYEIL